MAWGHSKIRPLFAAGLAAAAAVFGPSVANAGVNDRPFFRANAVVIVFGGSDFSENGGVAPYVFDFALLNDDTPATAATDLILADGVTINFNTNSYNPISNGQDSGWEYQINNPTFGGQFNSAAPHQTLDADDSYNAFGLDDTTDIDLLGGGGRSSRFYVASNAPFDIFGEARNLETSGDFVGLDYSNIRYRLRINVAGGSGANRWGARAQNPSTGGSGVVIGGAGLWTLDDLSTGPVKVFDGGQRTAAAPGGLMQQAVSFQSRYNLRQAGVNGNNYDFSMGAGGIGAEVVYTIYTP